jgi:hypothetical protein
MFAKPVGSNFARSRRFREFSKKRNSFIDGRFQAKCLENARQTESFTGGNL